MCVHSKWDGENTRTFATLLLKAESNFTH